MKVNFSNCIQNYSPKIPYNQDTVEFKGIRKYAEKRIFVDPEILQTMLGVQKNSYAGELPDTFVRKIGESCLNEEEKAEKIKKAIKAFGDCADCLREIEKEAFNKYEPEDYMNNLLREKYDCISFDAKCAFSISLVDFYTYDEAVEKAENVLKAGLVEAGVIPEDGKVSVKYIDSGMHGNAFEISFFDKDDYQLYHKKVLKLYKAREYDDKIAEKLAKASSKRTGKDFKDYKKIFYDEITRSRKYHGIYAEANRALFIKHELHNIKQSNFIEPFLFDFEKEYALMEYCDGFLPSVKKKFDFDKYGLVYQDLNGTNYSHSRIFDYGGICTKEDAKNMKRIAFVPVEGYFMS